MDHYRIVAVDRDCGCGIPPHYHVRAMELVEYNSNANLPARWTAEHLAANPTARFCVGAAGLSRTVDVRRDRCPRCGQHMLVISPPAIDLGLPSVAKARAEPSG
jgi:hypothetical protein